MSNSKKILTSKLTLNDFEMECKFEFSSIKKQKEIKKDCYYYDFLPSLRPSKFLFCRLSVIKRILHEFVSDT